MSKVLFYTKLAKYYDQIYHYVDYKKQTEFFVKLIKEFNESKNNKILDVACGTGLHADFLQKRGFAVKGFDISKEMLGEAKKKNSKVRFIQGDMKKLKLNEKFGVIICFFNSILYNKNKEEMKKTLINFHNHLEKGGILIFDAVDKSIGANSKKEEYLYEDNNLKIIFQPQWVYNQKEDIMNLEIDFIVNDEKLHDHQAMGSFSFKDLKEILEDVGFEVIILKRDFERITEMYEKKTMIFLCKK